MTRSIDQIGFDNSFAALPSGFYAPQAPTPVAAPHLIKLNVELAEMLGLDPAMLAGDEGVAMLAGNRVPEGASPIALAYAGHQFGHFVPQLGDGRAVLLGEVIGRDGVRRDLQLKGSGPTPFSRQGDGRAELGPVLREYLVSEAMAALGIPTTRALAAVLTGEEIWREGALPGAVLTRVARSHIRVGTFQFHAMRDDQAAIRRLADYVIARHYPAAADAEQPYRTMLEAICRAQAQLVARWMQVGLIHGVMNTDNMSIAGETIDYGPCAFLDVYHPAKVFSSIDRGGRYAYGNQPRIALWNLARLAECLLPLLDADQDAAVKQAEEALGAFATAFEAAYAEGWRKKLGFTEAREGDMDLVRDLLDRMAKGEADFTLVFRRLCDAAGDPAADDAVRALFADSALYDDWSSRWRDRLAAEEGKGRGAMMRAANPAFIPRNHRIEQAIAAARKGDYGPFETLLAVLARPFDDQPDFAAYMAPPTPDEVVTKTFCGT